MPVTIQRGQQRHPLPDGVPGFGFCTGPSRSLRGYAVRVRRRHDEHAVLVRDDQITGVDGDPVRQSAAYLNRNLMCGDLPPADGLRGRAVPGDDRKHQFAKVCDVTDAAVHDDSRTAPYLHGLPQQVTETTDAMDIRARPDRNHSLRHAVDGRELLSISTSVKRHRSPKDRESRPDEPGSVLNGEKTFGKHGWRYSVAVKNIGYNRGSSIKKELQLDSS
jgi:hypothetical protein